MPYTIADARLVVLENLDDETGTRYARSPGTNTEDYTKIDRALRGALSSCLDDYNGDRFDEQLAVTTSATDGTADLSAEQIAKIKNVRVIVGSASYRVQSGDVAAGGLPDLTARSLTLTIVRTFPIAKPVASPTTDLLVGTTSGAARSWDAFDEWVCARAADALGAKDDETRAAIQRSIERLEKAVKGHNRIPQSKPWPERRVDGLYLSGRLRWLWFAKEQEFQLVFNSGAIS